MGRFLSIVVGAGGAGGLVGWVYSATVGQPLALPVWGAIVASGVLGAGASLIGIMLANTDRKDVTRAVVFAFTCGVFWRPVYEAGGAYVRRLPEVKKEQTTMAAAQRLDETLSALGAISSESPELDARVRLTGEATTTLLKAAGSLADVHLRTRYQERAVAAVDAVARSAAPAETKAKVLTDVALVAAAEAHPEVAVAATAKIDEATRTAADPRLHLWGEKTRADLKDIAVANGDERLQRELGRMGPSRS